LQNRIPQALRWLARLLLPQPDRAQRELVGVLGLLLPRIHQRLIYQVGVGALSAKVALEIGVATLGRIEPRHLRSQVRLLLENLRDALGVHPSAFDQSLIAPRVPVASAVETHQLAVV